MTDDNLILASLNAKKTDYQNQIALANSQAAVKIANLNILIGDIDSQINAINNPPN